MKRFLNKVFLFAAVAVLFATATIGRAESDAGGDDPFAAYLFAPDRVMAHSLDIHLEDAQKTAIRNEVQKVQSRFLDAQFELQGESEKMVKLLQEPTVDETKVLAEVDRVLVLEKEIKKTQIALLVRIRNILTPPQRARLAEIQKSGGK
jgi:Spy/CpxP family protein refolding chaperone